VSQDWRTLQTRLRSHPTDQQERALCDVLRRNRKSRKWSSCITARPWRDWRKLMQQEGIRTSFLQVA